MRQFFTIAFLFVFLFSCDGNRPKQKDGNPDSRQRSIVKDYNRMDQVARQSIDSMQLLADKLSAKTQSGLPEYKAMAAIAQGTVYMNRSQYELAFKSFETTLKLLRNSKADTLKARAMNGIGNYYKNTGNYPMALRQLFAALKIFEEAGNLRGIATTNANIGQVYLQKNEMKRAEEFLKNAMSVYSNHKSHYAYLGAAHALANVNGIQGKYDEALKIDKAAISICDSINTPKIKVQFLDNMAMCYMYMGKLDRAKRYFDECLDIDISVGDRKQVADSYSNLGNLELMKYNFPKAEAYINKSLEMLDTIANRHNQLKCFGILCNIYEQSGQLEKANHMKDRYLDAYKALMNESNEAATAEFRIVHETEKKEKIIVQNRVELLEKANEVRRRNNFIVAISLGATFIALTGFLIYRQQKLKNRQQAQEHELKTAIAQIETQRKLQEQRLGISRDLHDNIGAQLTFIISSVDNLRYAFDIKNPGLEKKLRSINDFTRETIVELRDTIWAMNHFEISLEDLRIRIFNFIEKAKDARQGIGFTFDIDPELKQSRFSSVSGMNIYRTIQEAVNNAIKYASAANIGVFIEGANGGMRIRIDDDGIGFVPESGENGNGMANMKKRILDLNGTLDLSSSLGKGTHITINLPGQFVQHEMD